MVQTVTIARRFRGPPDSGNGGYSAGVLAGFVDGTARVRLHVPPPLDTELEVRRDGDAVTLQNGDERVASAWPATLDLPVPAAPDVDGARSASGRYRGHVEHFYPGCFVCGTGREPGDGLRIFAGPLNGDSLVAAPLALPGEFAAADGRIGPELVWSALDCPGAYAFPPPASGSVLLGELTARIDERPYADEALVVVGWDIATAGRKHTTGTALYRPAGELLAQAKATWFEVP